MDWKELILYATLVIIFAWAVGKITGLIQTPLWLEFLPLLVVPFGVGAGYQKIKNLLETINKRVEGIGKETKNIGKRLAKLEIEHEMYTKRKVKHLG